MAGRYDKPGSQGEWPYPGSGPSGSSDTGAGLARLEALGNVGECDLPSRQGEATLLHKVIVRLLQMRFEQA